MALRGTQWKRQLSMRSRTQQKMPTVLSALSCRRSLAGVPAPWGLGARGAGLRFRVQWRHILPLVARRHRAADDEPADAHGHGSHPGSAGGRPRGICPQGLRHPARPTAHRNIRSQADGAWQHARRSRPGAPRGRAPSADCRRRQLAGRRCGRCSEPSSMPGPRLLSWWHTASTRRSRSCAA